MVNVLVKKIDGVRAYCREVHCERQEEAVKTLGEVCRLLDGTPIKTIEVAYDGYGDNGAIESVDFFDTSNQLVDEKKAPILSQTNQDSLPKKYHGMTLERVIELAIGELLPLGFEIDDGSFGTARIDVPNGDLFFEHGWRKCEIEEDTFCFDLGTGDE